ncbi:GGDEF domain-containing protein [Aquisalibacillus elongatus]|uniref:Diguanylate cyclase (GGDEF)-like protein n=1 Tax=Aquisalibacillus elongatus TaxID=485577 RepID=A0A3N5CEY6_9BACI|nr:GGDEF domain-containing protein [Aquisalibacillus elongatus]RPF55831.1 diguanylate cyclase (GGDEF)-like protein [Aquisalibacillus elongatus]
MKRLYLTDLQTEQLFSTIRWFFLIVCGGLFYYEPFRNQLNLNLETFDYLFITALAYMFITQIALFISSNREKLQKVIIHSGIIFDFVVIFWLIALSGGIESLFVPIVYLFIMHATIYWRTRGLLLATSISVLSYSAIALYPTGTIPTDLIWEFGFNLLFFIVIGLFAGILALRERKHLKEKVTFHDLSIKDHVSGLYNHRSFQNTLSKLVQAEQEFTLIMADIDNFKQINDECGHTIGDQVISAFGNTLTHELDKPNSFAFRYGGEEFAIILFDRQKRSIEQRIKQCNKLFQHGVNLIPELKNQEVTISYGVAYSYSGDEKEDLIRRADDYLYLAKSNGKDRIMFQESSEHIGELT